MTTYTVGAYDSTTNEVEVSFTYNNIPYTRKVKAVLTVGGSYDSAATLIEVEKIFSGFAYQSQISGGGGGGTQGSGLLAAGVWAVLPAIYYLIIDGTGLITIDTKNTAGTITTSVETITATGTESFHYPYYGAGITQIRANYTGSAQATLV